jgi:hypothetical protein
MNSLNLIQALMSLAFLVTFVSKYICFLITLTLVNMFMFNVNIIANSCNVL